MATLTGLEPATSAVTGRHANQLRYRAILVFNCIGLGDPNGIRTRATAVKGRRPRPLDDGGQDLDTHLTALLDHRVASIVGGVGYPSPQGATG